MDPAIGEALEELSFVNKIYTYHQAFNPDAESDYGYYPESVSRLRLDGRLREVLEQEHAQVGETIETSSHLYREGEDVDLGVLGIEAEAGDESVQKEQEEQIDQIIAEYFNTQVQLSSKYATRAQDQIQKDQKMLLGLFVSIIFGLIGLVNIVNTLVTDVLARKIEFASLQSIGMIGRQMRRLKALLQRSEKKDPSLYQAAGLCYDFTSGILKKDGNEVKMSRTEQKILEMFLKNPNQVLTTEILLERVWDVDGNFVDKKCIRDRI